MPVSRQQFDIRSADILFEDADLIVINKPSGIPSQATLDPERDHCFAAVQRYLKKQNPNAYAGLHHRLDAQTSGALLMTKSADVNAAISEQFQQHTIEKKYCAICIGTQIDSPDYCKAGNTWVIDKAIGEVPGSRIQKFGVDGKKRKPARTRVTCELFETLRDGGFGVYLCSPETGRTHQIRVHLSSLGLGIIGDSLYGMPLLRSLRSMDPKRMCLHAQSIAFTHPRTLERMEICAPLPEEMALLIRRVKKLVGG